MGVAALPPRFRKPSLRSRPKGINRYRIMNKERRLQLVDIIDHLFDAIECLDDIRRDEIDAFDNIPESLQNGSTGISMQEAIDMMDSWEDKINDIIHIIENYSSGTITTSQANMTTYTMYEPTPAAQICALSNHSITIYPYNDKSFVIRGNTRAISDKLKEFGAKFNSGLNGGPGWIISAKHENKFRSEFALYI